MQQHNDEALRKSCKWRRAEEEETDTRLITMNALNLQYTITHTPPHATTYALVYELSACTQHLSCLFKQWFPYILIQLVSALRMLLHMYECACVSV